MDGWTDGPWQMLVAIEWKLEIERGLRTEQRGAIIPSSSTRPTPKMQPVKQVPQLQQVLLPPSPVGDGTRGDPLDNSDEQQEDSVHFITFYSYKENRLNKNNNQVSNPAHMYTYKPKTFQR
jgi:hypothetical protein